MKTDDAAEIDKELSQTKVNNKDNDQLRRATMLSEWNSNKIISNIKQRKRFKKANNTRQHIVFKTAKKTKENKCKTAVKIIYPNRFTRAMKMKQNRFKRAIKIKKQKELKRAMNVIQQHNNDKSCNSSSSSSTDCSSRQKEKVLRKQLVPKNDSSAISTEESDSTKSREARKRVRDTDGRDDDPKSMILSSWEKLGFQTMPVHDYKDFDFMQSRYGVALPFYLPTSIIDRFIDLKQMGKGERCSCPRIYIPVCSYNNRTYVNECIMNCIYAKKRRNGPCISYRRKLEPVEVFIPSEWFKRFENKIKPQKRKNIMRRILDKIKEQFKKFWNFITRTKQKLTIDSGRNYHNTEGIREYLIEHLTAMNFGDKIKAFSDNFVKIVNKTEDKKGFTDLFLRATYLDDDKNDFFDRFSNVIKSTENCEYYVKNMLLKSLGYIFYGRINSVFPRNVSDKFENISYSLKEVPFYKDTL